MYTHVHIADALPNLQTIRHASTCKRTNPDPYFAYLNMILTSVCKGGGGGGWDWGEVYVHLGLWGSQISNL